MRSLLPLLLLPAVAAAADPLPEGVEMRLGKPSAMCVDSRSAFSPDGKRLATIPSDDNVRVWDVATGELLYTHPKPLERVGELSWTPDGKLFGAAFQRDGLLLIGWADEKDAGLNGSAMKELRTASEAADPNAPPAHRSALARDGRRVAVLSNGEDGRVAVFPVALNTSTKLLKPEVTIPLPGGDFVGFSDDGNTLFTVRPSALVGDRVSAYDLTSKTPDKPVWTLELPREADREEVRDGKKVTVSVKGWPRGVRSRDGKQVVLEYPDPQGLLEVWDGPKGKKLHSWAFPRHDYRFEDACFDFSPDGKRLAVSAPEKGGLVGGAVYDLDTGKEVVKLTAGPCGWRADALRYTPDGKRLLRGCLVWDAATGKDLTPAGLGHQGHVAAVLVSGDGKTIVTSGSDHTARGWDAKTGQEKWRAAFPYVARELIRLDGDTAVAVSSKYDTPRRHTLVDLNTGKLSPLPGGMAKERTVKAGGTSLTVQSTPVAISPGGKTAVSVNWQKPALEVWDWPAGTRRAVLKFDPPAKTLLDTIDGVSFTADGNELIGVFGYRPIKTKPIPGVDGWGWRPEQYCLERWDISRETRVERVTYEKYTPAAVVTNGKRRLLVRPGKVKDLDTGETLLTVTDEEKEPLDLLPAILSADGKTLAASVVWDGRVELHWYDLTTGKQFAAFKGNKWDYFEQGQLALLPDGRLVSVGDEVLVWKAVK